MSMNDPGTRAHFYGIARHMVGVAELGMASEELKHVRAMLTECRCEACHGALAGLASVCDTLLWAFENAGQIIGDRALEHIGSEVKKAQQQQ